MVQKDYIVKQDIDKIQLFYNNLRYMSLYMKYYRNNKDNRLLSFTLDTNQMLDCYTYEDMLLTTNDTRNIDSLLYQGINFKKSQIRTITCYDNFPTDDNDIHFMMSNFAYKCINLDYVYNLDYFTNKVLRIPQCFRECDKFNQELNFLNTYETSGDIVYFSKNFNSSINFSNKLNKIRMNFLDRLPKFNTPLILPDSIKLIEFQQFMYNCNSFNSYIRVPSNFCLLLKKYIEDNPTVSKSFIMTCTNKYPWKIRGLTLNDFNELQKILPNNNVRNLIYDGE